MDQPVPWRANCYNQGRGRCRRRVTRHDTGHHQWLGPRPRTSCAGARLPRRVDQGDVAVPEHIDLRPLLGRPAAAGILLSARGQLNLAFRQHGLLGRDRLPEGPAGGGAGFQPPYPGPGWNAASDARQRHGEAFVAWAEAMPSQLAAPVLDILRRTHLALSQHPGDAGGADAAVLEAYDFLLNRSQRTGRRTARSPSPPLARRLYRKG